MKHIPDLRMTRRERDAFKFFDASTRPAPKDGAKLIPVPLNWLRHADYNLGNAVLSALGRLLSC